MHPSIRKSEGLLEMRIYTRSTKEISPISKEETLMV